MSVPPKGATLTEVLMSLLIMTIGVVSVISLFPLSIMRSIQATQLTNGKFAEQSAEQIIAMRPSILYGGVSEWTPGGTYPIYDPTSSYTDGVVMAPIQIGSHLPGSPKRFLCVDTTGGTVSPLTAGVVEPDWAHPVGIDTDGDSIFDLYGVYDTYDSDGDGVSDILWEVDTDARVIDPYGELLSDAGFETWFGNVDADSTATDAASPIIRINPFASLATAAAQLNAADAMFALPDSWVVELEAIPADVIAPDSAGGTQGEVHLSTDAGVPFAGTMRVTLVNINATQVVSRPIDTTESITQTGANGFTTVMFSWPDLPLSFDADGDGAVDIDDIGSVRIEYFERRYTWLFTVSQADANEQSRVTCVVFFNRGFSLEDEFLYDANFGNLSAGDVDEDGDPDGDIDGDGVVDFGGSDQVRVWWDAGDPDPNFRWGRFIFDGQAGHWYQVLSIDYIDETSTPRTAVLTLSDPVYVSTPTAAAVSVGTQGRAMLPRGIIHTFDLEL